MSAARKLREIRRLQYGPQLASPVVDVIKRFRSLILWAGFVLGLLLSPAIVVVAAPFGYGILNDLATQPWVAPAALMLAAALAINAARRDAAVRDQVAKSIT